MKQIYTRIICSLLVACILAGFTLPIYGMRSVALNPENGNALDTSFDDSDDDAAYHDASEGPILPTIDMTKIAQYCSSNKKS